MKKLMIDMDDVICTGGFMKIVNKFLNTSYTMEDVKGYYIQDLIPKEKNIEWINFFKNNNFYDYAELIPDAYDVIEELNQKYELYIVTAYVLKDSEEISGLLLKNKFEYLYKKLPFISPNQYIFINNKQLLDSDIIIDDKLSNLKGSAKMKILFPAYHNKNITKEEMEKEGVISVKNWKDIEKILL